MEVDAKQDDAGALLRSRRDGDLSARDRLFTLFYPELRRAAAAMVRRQPGLSMSTGDLIHEAVARLIGLKQIDWRDRAHFMAMSARMNAARAAGSCPPPQTPQARMSKAELTAGLAGEPNYRA